MTGEQPAAATDELLADRAFSALRGATPRVLGTSPGAGLLIASGHVLSCAHVVDMGATPGAAIGVQRWGGDAFTMTLIAIDTAADLALLGPPVGSPAPPALAALTPLPLNADLELGETLLAIGFPKGLDGRQERDEITARFEGRTDIETGRSLLKFERSHVVGGFSGGGLLNRRTGGICGLVKESRDDRFDLGGRAIPAADLRAFCAAAGLVLPGACAPTSAEPDLVDAFAALLTGLNAWRSPGSRRRFVQRALLGSTAGAVPIPPGGSPSDDALALALAVLAPEQAGTGFAAARRLLQALQQRPIGQATRAEAERLLRLLGKG
jgi:hypothetical protein